MKVENRNIKYPRIELRTGEVRFILPMNMNHHPIMDKYQIWINDKTADIEKALKNSAKLKLNSRSQQKLKLMILDTIDKYSDEYGVVVNRVILRELSSKWGSCSLMGNLTFNKLLSSLPDHHLQYIVFHELMHLIERKHTPKYWSLVSEKFKDYKKIEEELISYWFLINKVRSK
ncbi:MAG: M48 family metallopeptidase [Bacteroidia bacterium]|nr:M48 family metallopeptidase [Bacteroidia bacterium]